MRFFFDERKAAQTAAYLINRHGQPISLLKLIKLLYLADRKALLETGVTITSDRFVCMRHGLVVSAIYDKTKEDGTESGPWHQYIAAKEDNLVGLACTPDSFDELSKYERDVLETIYSDFGKMTPWQLRNYTHTLPEWVEPGDSSIPVDPANILRLTGRAEDDIRQLASDAEEYYFLAALGTSRQ